MLNKSDNGVYVCYADNGIGKGMEEYTLQVQGERGAPEAKEGGGVMEEMFFYVSSSDSFISSVVCCGFASIFFLV